MDGPAQIMGPLRDAIVVSTSVGTSHYVAATSEGDVYSWGEGVRGQLARKKESVALIPRFCFTARSHKVALVACGADFTLAVTVPGEVLSWGCGIAGQLGTGRCSHRGEPAVVLGRDHAAFPFARVAAGWAHGLARSSKLPRLRAPAAANR